MKYDLEDRTTIFSKRIISCCSQIEPTPINKPIINQLIRSATSVGANYFEANGASSKKDFRNKIHICKKEAKETTYWLRILEGFSENDTEIQELKKEAQELLLIFSKIGANSK